MSQKGFAVDWLNERFKYDNAARNPELEQAFLASIQGKEKLNIVDIGSGTGSNFLYFTERLPSDQNWVLIEQDNALCQAAKQRIAAHFSIAHQWMESTDKALRFQFQGRNITVQIVCDSFYNLPQIVDLREINVVLAAAVFDVLSREQFSSLMELLDGERLFLYATMNYAGMQFLPQETTDTKYVDLYENHMLRPQDFGRAIGKHGMREIDAYFQAQGKQTKKGKSLWHLDPEAKKMHSFILGFMEKSISELLHEKSEIILLQKWIAEKRNLSNQGKLFIEVAHYDFLVEL